MRNRTPNDIPTLVSGYLDQHLVRVRGLSPRTQEVYADSLLLFLQYASKEKGTAPDRLLFSDLGRELING